MRRGVATAAASNKPASAHQNHETAPASSDSPDSDDDGDGLAVGDGLIVTVAVGDGLKVTDRVTVDGLGAAVIVWVVVVSTRIGDREGFFVADGVSVGSSAAVGSSVGRLDESAGVGLACVGLGLSGRSADLVGVDRDTVGVDSWLAERDGDSGTSMFPPPAHDVSSAMAAAKPATFMTSVPTLSPEPARLHIQTPEQRLLELDTLRSAFNRRHIVASLQLS